MSGDRDDLPGEGGGVAHDPGKVAIVNTATATDPNEEIREEATSAVDAGQATGPLALRRPAILIAAAALLLTVVIIGVMMARRQIDAEPTVASETAEETEAPSPPESATVESPTLMGGEPAQPTTTPATDKIFNSATETMKEGAAAIARSGEQVPGGITELPPPPAGDFGNGALQNAAKDAAKALQQGPTADDAIDLSAPDRRSALDSLERVAQSSGGDFAPPAAPGDDAVAAAGLNRAIELQIADLNNSLGVARQHTAQQESEIARLNAELQQLKSGGAPAARRGRAAVALAGLAEKLRRGEPYRTDLDAYAALTSDTALVESIGTHADKGVATLADLSAGFSEPRNAALAEARRAKAAGPIGRLSANFASLINLRPAGPKAGADAVSVLSRAEAALSRSDLNAALSELALLDPLVAAPLGSWLSDARARLDAEAAVDAALAAGGAALSGEPVY